MRAKSREEMLEQALRDLVEIAEMDDGFNDPGESDAYAALYWAKAVLDPEHYANDHPCLRLALQPLLKKEKQNVFSV
jgi:hypothetical protein